MATPLYSNTLINDIRKTCAKYDITFTKYLLDDVYSHKCNIKMKAFCDGDGFTDSIRQCLYSFTDYNRTLINMLLIPF